MSLSSVDGIWFKSDEDQRESQLIVLSAACRLPPAACSLLCHFSI